jgi:potassium-dependent mechanosensitive channel
MRRRLALHVTMPLVLMVLSARTFAVTNEPTPEVIAAPAIPTRADIDARFANDVIELAQTELAMDVLEPALAELSRSVNQQSHELKLTELRLYPVVRLESLNRYWRFSEWQLVSWRAELASASDRYLKDAATIAERRAAWAATRAANQTAHLPAALLDRMTEVDTRLAEAEQALSTPLSSHIQLSERADSIGETIE